MKITSKHLSALYNMSEEQFNTIEMHSVLNILNVLHLQLDYLITNSGNNELIAPLLTDIRSLSDKLKKGDRTCFFPEQIEKLHHKIFSTLDYALKNSESDEQAEEILESRGVLEEIWDVARVRSREVKLHAEKPGEWIEFSVDEITDDFDAFFDAVEKNSKGQYRIVKNIAKQESKDYLVQFNVESKLGDCIYMPIIFKDVLRDLVANARKYTPRGGHITIGLMQEKDKLRFIVQDNGVGIPADEIDTVFEFGYRAKNVRSKPTLGGGFGLTKALYVTIQLKGDIWVESEVGEGTKITIEIPVEPAFKRKKLPVERPVNSK